MNLLSNLLLNLNQLIDAALERRSSAPSNTVSRIYYDTTLGYARIGDGTNWQRASYVNDVFDRANHTGSQAASTISDFDTQVRTSRLDQLAAPTASVPLNSQKITGLADGTNAADAVTYGQMIALLTGQDWKASVRVATTTALPSNSRSGNVLTASSNGALGTIDGVSLSVNDPLLVKNEATGANNGIYTVTALGDGSNPWTLTRRSDADSSAEVTAGLSVDVTEGSTYADKSFTLTTDDPITLNTTALTFSQGPSSNTYLAGNGLTLTGSTFSVQAHTGISVSGSGVAVDTSVVARKYTATLGNGSSTTIAVTHGLDNQWVTVMVVEVATLAQVFCDVVLTDANTVTLSFTTAPTTNQYRVIVTG